MVFDRIAESVFEQQIIDCPFCSNSYVSKDERRPLIQCPVCQGNAQLAREAEDEMEYIRQNLDRYTVDEIAVMIRKLGPGLFRSDFRTVWWRRQRDT